VLGHAALVFRMARASGGPPGDFFGGQDHACRSVGPRPGPAWGAVFNSKEGTRKYYDRIAGIYDLMADHSEAPARQAGLDLLAVQPGEKVLEVGFGTGHCLAVLAQAVGPTGQVYGIDIAERDASACRGTQSIAPTWHVFLVSPLNPAAPGRSSWTRVSSCLPPRSGSSLLGWTSMAIRSPTGPCYGEHHSGRHSLPLPGSRRLLRPGERGIGQVL
jgi:hypothetical protein